MNKRIAGFSFPERSCRILSNPAFLLVFPLVSDMLLSPNTNKRQQMALTAIELRNTKAADKPQKLSDGGGSLQEDLNR